MTPPPFETVLVANRGEIACRVIGTLRALGIRSVAVYSDADAEAKHVGLADVAVRIGPAPAAQSYLSIPAILDAAARTGAQAIHPGYGFLSENIEFAQACAEAGIVFIGPGVGAIEAMGDKITAKARVTARGVPVVPGSSGTGLDDAALTAAAADVGYPLLIKPSAGGGGKGMQIVRSDAELPEALKSARRVAAGSFGDDTLLLERLIERPRHIEVQVLADRHGAVVHLGERECSLQRRHQKVIEESPSPLLDAPTRARIGEAACEVARSVDYEGAGTVEFLISDADPETFYFIEMNTRLQVEHPVTEMVTGLDLVELQLRIAAGEPLPFGQADVVHTGHAIEARIYAESPERGFLPATGTVLALEEPAGEGLRMDSSLVPGLVVSGDYDPMLAKAIAYGADRVEALARLDALLAGTVILGLDTNVGFLRTLLATSEMQEGKLDTGLIDRLGPPNPGEVDDDSVIAAALLLHFGQEPSRRPGPWGAGDGWRLNAAPSPGRYWIEVSAGQLREVLVGDGHVRVGDGPERTATLAPLDGDAWRLTLDGDVETLHLATPRRFAIRAGLRSDARSARDGADAEAVWVRRDGRVSEFRAPDRSTRVAESLARLERAAGPVSPEVRTAMPGTVVTVSVGDGDAVEAGATLVTIEAMKMEHPLVAPLAGVVRINIHPGDLVRRDQVVAVVEPHESIPERPQGPTPEEPT